MIAVVNKTDTAEEDFSNKLSSALGERGFKPIFTSLVRGEGLGKLREEISREISRIRKEAYLQS